jgi:hypothetical protein
LIDLMAAVVAAALCLAWVVSTARGRAGPAMIVIGPLIGILYHRWRGGRGILGGALGGAVYAGVGLIVLACREPGWIAKRPVEVAIMATICLAVGTLMGLAAWLVATMMGRSVSPHVAEPK